MYDYYGAGLIDGMFIQAADQRNRNKTEKETAAVQALKLGCHLAKIGRQDIIDKCLRYPEDIQFYYNLYSNDFE